MGVFVIITSGVCIEIGTICLIVYGNNQAFDLINNTFAKNIGYEKELKLFEGTHYVISKYKYNKFRIILAVVIAVIGMFTINKSIIIASVIIYFSLYPKRKIYNFRLPFYVIDNVFRKKDMDEKDQELLEVLSLLKNMMVQLRNNPKGADYIIDYLSNSTKLTKPAFLKFLNLIRLGNVTEAEKTFVNEIKTTLAADTARILVQLDIVSPIALEQSLASIQNEIREIGTTNKQIKNELYSYLILIPIIATIIAELLNFLIVAYIGEISRLSYFFNM